LDWMIHFAMAQPSGEGGASPFSMLIPILGMLAIFYFLLIRPQQRRQKDTQKMVSSLKNGDRVLTSSGIYGTVTGVKDNSFMLKIADNVKVEILKTAVTGVVEKGNS
jgi:preprotein translocase subunit YajC